MLVHFNFLQVTDVVCILQIMHDHFVKKVLNILKNLRMTFIKVLKFYIKFICGMFLQNQ